MVDFNDRRNSIGSGDFNNPKGTYELITHGYAEQDSWHGMSPQEAKTHVHSYYSNQKGTATWREATRLAKQRTDHQARTSGFSNGADYADAYQGHLIRVMSLKGRDIADRHGELGHRQSGYGRT